MKTLRHLVKGRHTEGKCESSRKVSLPVQHHSLEQFQRVNESKKESLWANVKRKISLSTSTEESLKIRENQKNMEKYLHTTSHGFESSTTVNNPKLRRVNSEVTGEDVMLFATIEGDVNLLKRTIDSSQVNINYMRPPGTAPLHQACMTGNLEIVELLIKSGANIYLRDHRELSPLQIANIYGHFEIAEFLIRMGSPVVDIKDGFQIEKRKRKRSRCFSFGPRYSAYEPTEHESTTCD